MPDLVQSTLIIAEYFPFIIDFQVNCNKYFNLQSFQFLFCNITFF